MAKVKANDSVSALGYTCGEEDLVVQALVEAREPEFTAFLRGRLAAWLSRRLV